MKRNIKRAISLLVCFALVVAFVPGVFDTARAGEGTAPDTSNALVNESFNEGLPTGWEKYDEFGRVTTGDYVSAAADGGITITGSAILRGVGTVLSVADKGAHNKLRLSFTYSGAGALVTRVYDAETGAYLTQLFNTPATAEGATVVAYLDLPAGVENITMTLLAMRNQGDITIDNVKAEYCHTYDQQKLSDEQANAATDTRPAAYYIKCDTCDVLAKDDATYTGAIAKYVGAICYEDFEYTPVGEKQRPDGWTGNDYGSYGVAEESGNRYFYVHNNHVNTSNNMTTRFDLGDYGTHTKAVISMKVKGGGDFAGVLQTAFKVYNADDTWINTRTTGDSAAYNKNFDNTTWDDWTQITIVKDIVLSALHSATGADASGVTAQLQLTQRWNATGALYIDEITVSYVHTYEQSRDSGVAAPGGTYIKCDHCDQLKAYDPTQTEDFIIPTQPSGSEPSGSQPSGSEPSGSQPSGSEPSGSQPSGSEPSGSQPSGSEPSGSQPSGSEPAPIRPSLPEGILVDEGFSSGLPTYWEKYNEYGAANGSVTVTNGEGNITIDSTTVHWGVGTEFSVADRGAHNRIRLSFTYSGAGALIARTYNVATGTLIKQLFNTPATAEGKTETAVLDLPAGVENIRLTLLALQNAGSITIDNVKVEYCHTYDQQKLSDEQANAATDTRPAAKYIKCDTCDVLAKDDATYTGATAKYVGAICYEDFEYTPVSENQRPDGWTGNNYGSYGVAEESGNRYFYVHNNHVNTSNNMTTRFDLGDYGTHTKAVISMKVKGGGDFAGVLQTAFKVYNADDTWINNNTSGNSYAYNKNFDNTTWDDWTRITIVKDIVLPDTVAGAGVDPNGTTAELQLVQRFGATAALYIDEITVSYGHTYEQGRNSGIAAEGGTYIKCDHCDALKVNDADAEGDVIIPGGSTQPDGSEPSGSEPSGSEPSGSEPSGSEPSGSEPSGSEPSGSQPSGSEPSGSQPSGSEPSGSQPGGSQPSGSQSNGVLVDEGFNSGLPAGWDKYDEFGKLSSGVIVNTAEGGITIQSSTAHLGVGTVFSVADRGAHNKLRLTITYSGTGSLIARTYDAATGELIKQLFNTPATAEGNPVVAYLDLSYLDVATFALRNTVSENIKLTLLALKNAGDITIDSVKVEFCHTYEQKLLSNVQANAASAARPAAYYIKCDTCDALAKDDASYTGATAKYVGVLYYDDFEYTAADEKKLPAESTLVNGVGSYGVKEESGNNYYYFNNNHINTPTGAKIKLDLANRGEHTKVVISMKVKGGGDFPGVLQSSFMVYNADGEWINNNTSSKNYAYNDNYSNVSWEDWTEISIEKLIVLPESIAGTNVDNNGATATWQFVQRFGATAALYIDEITVDYPHTYEQGLNSGVAAEGGTYIKCDHCDALKVNDANAEGDVIIPGGSAQPGGSQPGGSQPGGSQPSGSEPSGSQPSGSEPSGSQPSGSQPSGSQPEASEPSGEPAPTGDYTALALMMVVMTLACVALIVTKVKFGYRK